ncbi:MAG: hypothetical protein WC284_16070 [Candidimonas sp.]
MKNDLCVLNAVIALEHLMRSANKAKAAKAREVLSDIHLFNAYVEMREQRNKPKPEKIGFFVKLFRKTA